MRKIFTLLFALAMSIGTLFANGAFDDAVYIDGYYYVLTDGIAGRPATATLVPDTNYFYNGLPNNPYCSTALNISSVSYNDKTYYVKRLEESVFYGCSNLKSISLPSVIYLHAYAFANCTSLTSIDIHPTSISDHVFEGCTSLSDLSFLDGCTSIGEGAFAGCKALESLVIPSSLSSIGNMAFSGCTGLTSITCEAITPPTCEAGWNGSYTEVFNQVDKSIPLYVPRVSIEAYKEADGWKDFTNIQCTGTSGTCGDNLTWELSCDSVLTISGTGEMTSHPWLDYKSFIKTVDIKEGVTSIGERAFYMCSGLTSVTIPNSVTSIGELVFYNCTSLTSPIYNAHVFAYMPLSYLGTYTILDGIESIVGDAFYGCSGLTSIEIPNSVTSIGNYAFRSCTSLTSVEIPNSVTSIGEGAFSGCSSLTSIEIPNSVTSIGYNAFYNCTGLTSITIPNSVTSIGSSALMGCSGLTSIEIPNSVTSIGVYAFGDCSGLTTINVATNNSNYCSIDGVVFNKVQTRLVQYPCGKQGSYTIPNSVTSIGEWAFFGCSDLTSVTIPNSVASIGEYAFGDCMGLTSITCEAVTPPTCGEGVFYKVDKSIPIYVPAGSEEAYQTADQWKEFENIKAIGEDDALLGVFVDDAVIAGTYSVKPGVAWTVPYQVEEHPDGLIELQLINPFACSGKEQGENMVYNGFPYNDPGDWDDSKDYNLVLQINTSSGEVVFVNDRNDLGVDWNFGKMYLSAGDSTIGTYDADAGVITFRAANKTLAFGMGEQIYNYAAGFSFYLDVEAFEAQNPYHTIGDLYYSLDLENRTAKVIGVKDYSIEEVVISESVKYQEVDYRVVGIENSAFKDCGVLKSVVLPESITFIGDYAFSDCSDLATINLPESVTEVGFCSFDNCENLTAPVYNSHIFACLPRNYEGLYEIPDGIERIVTIAFGNCAGLTDVHIPNSVKHIERYAFFFCTGLKQVMLPNSVISMGDRVFASCNNLTSILVEEGSTAFSSVDGVLFNKDQTTLVMYPRGRQGAYTIPNSVTKVDLSAFEYCEEMTSVVIGSNVSIIEYCAFNNCTGLTSITCEALTPPECRDNSFSLNDNSIPVYVPAGSVEAYKTAIGWKEFENIQPIQAEEVPVTEIEAEPTYNSVVIEWPKVDEATVYTIEIRKDGELVCTLTFNEQGQLQGITFAKPSRNGGRNSQVRMATQTATGWQYTISGLDPDTEYTYSVVAKKNAGDTETLFSDSVTFTTKQTPTGVEEVSGQKSEVRKLLRNGQLYILRDGEIFNARGARVE